MQTPPRSFDDSKLEAMTEPLMVRVEKIKGGSRMPIPLPEPEDGGAPGTGYTKELIRSHLEQFLVTEWVGGGLYDVTVTDSSTPPIVMKWQPSWDVRQFPEKVPPPLASAMSAENAAAVVVPFPAQPASFTPRSPVANPFPNGFPSYGHQQPVAYPQMPAPPPVTSPAYSAWIGEAERRKQEDELQRLREQNAQREREAIAAQHKAEMDRVRVEADQKAQAMQRETERRFSELQATISGLTSQLTQAQSRPAIDPQLEALKEANRQLAEKAETERREREAERRDAQLRDMIKAQSDAAERRIEAMQQMHAASMAQMQTMITQMMQNSNKGDQLAPLISMMNEQARQNADAIKEVARQGSDQMNKLSGFMMNPRDMIAMARDTQTHTETTAERMSSMYGRAFDLQARAVESALQMNQGGSQTAELVGMGIEKVTGLADRWIGGKTAADKFQLQAQRDVAEMNTRAIEAQAAVEMARSGAIVTPAPQQQGQLNGPSVVMQQPQTIEIPSVPVVGKKKKAKADATTSKEVKRLGRTDREWFTDALMEHVENTRNGVEHFHESARTGRIDKRKLDRDGQPMPEGFAPQEVAIGIVQGVAMAQQVIANTPGAKAPPAMQEVLFQERYADFIDLLIPDASQKYRDEVVQELIAALKQATGETPQPKPATVAEVDAAADSEDEDEGEEGEEDEDDDEDEDPEADPNDGKVVEIASKSPKSPKNGRPNPRA